MNFLKKFTAIFLLVIFTACSNNDDGNTTVTLETDLNLVTGINIRSDEFSNAMTLGNPNVYTENLFVVYPNPTTNYITLRSNETIESVWVTPATAQKIYQDSNFNSLLNSNTYSQTTVTSNAEIKILNVDSETIVIDLRTFNPGYYKVFLKINGNLYWDNICVFENTYQIEDIIGFWE